MRMPGHSRCYYVLSWDQKWPVLPADKQKEAPVSRENKTASERVLKTHAKHRLKIMIIRSFPS
jgi:hypothetical protein